MQYYNQLNTLHTTFTTDNQATPTPAPATTVEEPEIDFATAILTKKTTPNTLLVDDNLSEDHSVVVIDEAKMAELGLFSGDYVMLKGKKRRSTVAVVWFSPRVKTLISRDYKIRGFA